MVYTLDHYCCFNWYHWTLSIGINFDLSCILIYVCMYVCFQFQQYQFRLVLNFSYIYMFYLCLFYPYIFKHKILFMLSLSFNFVSIDQFSIAFLFVSHFKPTHCFCWYFIKGEKNSIFIFQLVFVSPLPSFMIENKNFKLISYT